MIDAHSLNAPAGTTTVRIARWTPGGCVWCGSTDSVETFRNEPRCGLCREKEAVIDEAKHFIDTFIRTPFTGEERHARRIAQLAEYETTGSIAGHHID